jgi:hypothetical protein
MTEFAIGRYGDNDFRLIKWDGSVRTEIGDGWPDRPSFEEQLQALFDHHGVGNSPFSSQEATIDSLILSDSHVPTTDKGNGHPWPWEQS